jgi:hypothetical protein
VSYSTSPIITIDICGQIQPRTFWNCFQIGEKSEEQGYNVSRLPEFTEAEKLEIAGSSDFLGINHYTSNLVYPMDPRRHIHNSLFSFVTN